MNYSKQDLRKKLFEAPENIQDLVFSPEKSEKIKAVAKKFNLNDSQALKLEEMVNVVLIGLEPLSKFRSLVVGLAGITYDQAIKVSPEINGGVFEPVLEQLKSFETRQEQVEDVQQKEPIKEVQNRSESTLKNLDHLLPSHEMIGEPHVHSQTLMPKTSEVTETTGGAVVAKIQVAPIPVPQPPGPKLSSIVDQKLSKLVRTERDQTQVKNEVEEKRKNTYTGGDPYREPIK